METLEQIIALIKQNPSITVKGLIQKLGYSESKTIYYWLQKVNYRSFPQFKRDVLRGDFPAKKNNSVLEESLHYSQIHIPLCLHIAQNGKMLFAEDKIMTIPQTSNSEFAYELPTDEYGPWLAKGSLLILNPVANIFLHGKLYFLQLSGPLPILRRYYRLGQQELWLHPIKINQPDEQIEVQHIKFSAQVLKMILNA